MNVVFPISTPRQFAVVREEDPDPLQLTSLPRSWAMRSFAGVKLFSDGELPVTHCRFADGATAGFMLGEPIDPYDPGPIAGELTFEPIERSRTLDEWIEEQVYRYAGRFVFVLTSGAHRRMYLDAAGLLPVVYDRQRRIAGSTAAALLGPAEFVDRFDRDLFTSLDLLGGGWLPGGLTAHHGIERLLCNFYLDLNQWTVHRHWPTNSLDQAEDPLHCSREVGKTIRGTIAAYQSRGSVCLALTGGCETRLLLSLTRDLDQPTDFACFFSRSSDRDAILSERLADRFGLRLRKLKFPSVSGSEADQWMARSGYCIAENRHTFAVTRELADFDYFLGGVAGEVGRGFFWRAKDGSSPLTAAAIYNRLGLPPCEKAKEAVRRWSSTLPDVDPLLALDLAYLELRVCCWASVQAYSAVGPKHVYPMVSRTAFSQMLSLPPAWRRNDKWLRIVIESNWPELLAIPINNLGPLREAMRSAARVIRRPSLIARRWRRRFA